MPSTAWLWLLRWPVVVSLALPASHTALWLCVYRSCVQVVAAAVLAALWCRPLLTVSHNGATTTSGGGAAAVNRCIFQSVLLLLLLALVLVHHRNCKGHQHPLLPLVLTISERAGYSGMHWCYTMNNKLSWNCCSTINIDGCKLLETIAAGPQCMPRCCCYCPQPCQQHSHLLQVDDLDSDLRPQLVINPAGPAHASMMVSQRGWQFEIGCCCSGTSGAAGRTLGTHLRMILVQYTPGTRSVQDHRLQGLVLASEVLRQLSHLVPYCCCCEDHG